MPKQKHTVPEQYLSWLEFVPEAQREAAKAKWLANDNVRGLANAIGGMNEAQRQAAQWKVQAEHGQQLANSLAAYQDILPTLHEYAPIIRRHRASDLAALASQPQAAPIQGAVVANRQERAEIEKQIRSGNLDWSEGQQEILRLDSQLAEIAATSANLAQRFSTLTEQQVPQVLAKWEQQMGHLDQRRRDDNLETIRFNAKTMKYFREHPDRDPEELYTALKENPAGFSDFEQLASSVYGDDDVAAQVERAREEERTKMKAEYDQRALGTETVPGEGPFNTGQSAIVRRRRQTEEQNRPRFPRNDGEATEQLQQFFARRQQGTSTS